ncbi:hypothetical protein [Streptomyces venezuelae]|uniref:hypothetical protein n=1 Tax=Streptomyces venezuelae TaxID=54571 RepID=UPI00123B4524|nr:hypothetical protein [Streptomyces venezuelae]
MRENHPTETATDDSEAVTGRRTVSSPRRLMDWAWAVLALLLLTYTIYRNVRSAEGSAYELFLSFAGLFAFGGLALASGAGQALHQRWTRRRDGVTPATWTPGPVIGLTALTLVGTAVCAGGVYGVILSLGD